MRRLVKVTWGLLVGACLSVGPLISIPFLFAYNQLKPLGDAISKDGDLESFNPALYRRIKLPILAIGFFLLCAGIFLIIQKEKVQTSLVNVFSSLSSLIRRLKPDSVSFFHDLLQALPRKWELAGISFILIGAFLGRLFFINLPIDYDEAYTFSEFAQYSFRQAVSDYHVPNNHVLNTIFVRVSFLIFGGAPWAIRIPVFIVGMILVFITYIFAKKAYSTLTGFLSAGLIASAPMLIYYSVASRGYMWVSLFTMMTFTLGLYVRWHKNLLGWGMLIFFTAAGFYAIPIMLFPYAILITWLFFCGLTRDIDTHSYSFKGWLKYIIVASLLAGLFTVCLYSPILMKNGISHFFNGARVVESLNLNTFLTTLPDKVNEIAIAWRLRTTAFVQLILLLGIILSFVFNSRISKIRFPVQAALIIAMSTILLIQRPFSMPRIWLWLMPFLLMWASAGLIGILNILIGKWKKIIQIEGTLVWLAILLVMGSSLWNGWLDSPKPGRIYPGDSMQYVMQFIKPNLTPEDVIVSPRFYNAMFWYYGRYLNIPTSNYRAIKSRPFYRAFVIVYPAAGDTYQTVISRDGPDIGFFDLDSAKLVYSFNDGSQDVMVYSVDTIPEYVDKAYGVKKNNTIP